MNCCTKEWIIELTGGEPGLFDGIDDLGYRLESQGYRGLIKSNGNHDIKRKTFQLIAAWHTHLPKYYDTILIIQNENYQEKITYCKKNHLPFKTITERSTPSVTTHSFQGMLFITPDGKVRSCNDDDSDECTLYNRKIPQLGNCLNCKVAHDTEIFL
jgi:organic radical activating enzyme